MSIFLAEIQRKIHFSAGYRSSFAIFAADLQKILFHYQKGTCAFPPPPEGRGFQAHILMIIGREKEQRELLELLDKEESQFCAVYGRRRVGKTKTHQENPSRNSKMSSKV